jgi:FMN phosphatase YigB (HAD superfamily)
MRWSSAAKMPRRSWRARVGWPTTSRAKGFTASISALVKSRISSSCAGLRRWASSIYKRALEALQASSRDAWMVGDNLELDVAAPQRLGIHGVWLDYAKRGVPPGSLVTPDRIITALSELIYS